MPLSTNRKQERFQTYIRILQQRQKSMTKVSNRKDPPCDLYSQAGNIKEKKPAE